MYILLSSGAQKRYRDDILRCMSAPVGAVIQFRYGMNIVGTSITGNPSTIRGQQALVCNLDVEHTVGSRGEHPVIPVRHVIIDRVWSTGSTIVVAIKMAGFAHATNMAKFREAFYTSPHPPKNAPQAAEGGGLWCFHAPDAL